MNADELLRDTARLERPPGVELSYQRRPEESSRNAPRVGREISLNFVLSLLETPVNKQTRACVHDKLKLVALLSYRLGEFSVLRVILSQCPNNCAICSRQTRIETRSALSLSSPFFFSFARERIELADSSETFFLHAFRVIENANNGSARLSIAI